MKEWGLIDRLPRLAVIQAEGSAPFYELMQREDRSHLNAVGHPETLATAITALLGDPGRLSEMGRCSKGLGRADSAERVVTACQKLVQNVKCET